jgi:dihydrolipoamide dehydrogenase
MDRVKHERDRFVGFALRDVQAIPDAARIRGHAHFTDDHTLEVAGHARVTGKGIVIATGSSAAQMDSFTGLGDRLIISDDVFNWRDLPKAVAVIGPGIIGLELGQALHSLGVHVAVFGRGGRVGPFSDPEIRAYAIVAFNEEFMLEPDAHIADMQLHGNRVAIRRTGPDGNQKIEYFDYVLAVTGRTPNVKGIGLDNTTLTLDAKGVPAFDPVTTRTATTDGTSPIFIAGDASAFIPLLHEAADEGRTFRAGQASDSWFAPHTHQYCVHRPADRHRRRWISFAETRYLQNWAGEFRGPGPFACPAQEQGSA